MKRVITAVLSFIMLLSLLPDLRVKAQADETEIYEQVFQQIKTYADSINQSDAAKTAATSMLTNAAFRGKDLSLDADSALAATIFNSGLFQYGISHSLTAMIDLMQRLRSDSMLSAGGLNWYSHSADFGAYAYAEPVNSQAYYLGRVTSSEMVFGDKTTLLSQYNSNDKMLVMLAGSTQVEYIITRSAVGEDTVIYDIDLKIYDDFDYNAEYNDNYNRDFEKILSMFGGLTMSEFYWEINVSFRIEAPYFCDHTFGSYRWEFDAGSLSLTSDTSGNFLLNPTEYQVYTTTNDDGETRTSHYYKLADPVTLLHDRPWVVEYEIQGSLQFIMAPLSSIVKCVPIIYQYGLNYSWIGHYEFIPVTEDQQKELGLEQDYYFVRSYYGINLLEQNKFSTRNTYQYRLENVIAEDGSNMVYLTVYNLDSGEVVCGPLAMDDHIYSTTMNSEWILDGTENDWLNGRDIVIDYIGTMDAGLKEGFKNVAIYENGVSGTLEDTFVESLAAPTCSAEGYTAHTCTKCGYTYTTDPVEMLPHSYEDKVIAPTCTAEGYTAHSCKTCGHSYQTDAVEMLPHNITEYKSNNDATCSADGTKTGQCTVCGQTSTVPDEGSALPHTWAEATCVLAPTCKVCGAVKGEPLGHDLIYYNAKAPTCTRVGWDAYEKCQRCNHSTFATKPALGHNYVDGVCLNCGDRTFLLGDVNEDGEINIFDANLIASYYNELTELTEDQIAAADVNSDGVVDIFDANLVAAYYNEVIDGFPVE